MVHVRVNMNMRGDGDKSWWDGVDRIDHNGNITSYFGNSLQQQMLGADLVNLLEVVDNKHLNLFAIGWMHGKGHAQ